MKLGFIDWLIIGVGIVAVVVFTIIEVTKFLKEKKEKQIEQKEIEKGLHKEISNVVEEEDD